MLSTIKFETYIKKSYFTNDVRAPPKENSVKKNKEIENRINKCRIPLQPSF